MASSKVIVVASLTALAMLAAYAWHVQQGLPLPWQHDQIAQAPFVSPLPPPVAVETALVVAVPLPEEVGAVGNLRSNESVLIRPEVSGRISAIHFREGEPVSRGELMVELDAAVQRAELQQARASLELVESNHRRAVDLHERRFVSQSARDEAASRLEVARAALQLAQARLERMRIVAPFAGTVGIRNVSVGDYVKDGDVLVNLEDISILKIDFRLPEAYLPRLRPGQLIELQSDTLPGERFSAAVSAIDPLVDADGRAVVLRAELENPDGRLRPGMFGRIRVILQERPAVAVVPEEAIIPSAGATSQVFRIVDGRAERVEVRTGVRRGKQVEIVEGLAVGDTVVTAGQLRLRDGSVVREVSGATAGRPDVPVIVRDGSG